MKIADSLLDGDYDIHIPAANEYPPEISDLFEVFEGIQRTLHFNTSAFFKGNKDEILIKLADAYEMFSKYRNLKGMVSCMSKISEIHSQNNRLSEAESALEQAISIAKELTEHNNPLYQQLLHELLEKLADVCIENALQTGERHFWEKAINILTSGNFEDHARVHIKLAICYAWSLSIAKAENRIQVAEGLLTEESIYVQMFLFAKASLLHAKRMFKEAAYEYSNVLQFPTHYDPWVRKYCLSSLKRIFIVENLAVNLLEIPKVSPKEIVFLLDYSMNMKGSRYRKSLRGFSSLFDSLGGEDILSFVLYNRMTDVIFEKHRKSVNTHYLKHSIMHRTEPNGTSCLYDALCSVSKLLIDQTPSSSHLWPNLPPVEAHSKWLVVCTTGETRSKSSIDQIKRSLPQCSIIIIGVAFTEETGISLISLADELSAQLFLCRDHSDIPVSFENIQRILSLQLNKLKSNLAS